MTDTCINKNVIRYKKKTWISLCKQIYKQHNFLANGADLIDSRET